MIIFRKIINFILLILIPTIFCSIMSSPISYGLPLHCPKGSRVIGIECFDEAYNNTTPWYRRDFGATKFTFPYWLAGFTIVALFTYSWKSPSKNTKANQGGSVSTSQPIQNKQQPQRSNSKSKRWLPTNCPHCGGAISSESVEWLSSFEAKCPYCDSVLKETE